MKRRYWAILVGTRAVVVLIGNLVAAGVHQHRINAASLVSLGGTESLYPDGRDAQVLIFGNANDRPAAVLALHYSDPEPERHVIKGSRTETVDQPIEGLLSSIRYTTQYPPDPDASGLWIDGHKRPIGDTLSVIYISDKLMATDILISPADQPQFLTDARKLDPLRFIDKWISPRLPATK